MLQTKQNYQQPKQSRKADALLGAKTEGTTVGVVGLVDFPAIHIVTIKVQIIPRMAALISL